MSVPDDSALIHGRIYDPAKAREYYLRTRQLKGRHPGAAPPPSGGRPQGQPQNTGPHMTPSRRAELLAQRKALENRLNRLKDVLAEKVKAAKARSGVEDKTQSKDTPKETAAKNERDKKDTPLTAKQKREKAQKAKEQYKKDHPTLPQELVNLQRQIVEIRAKIQSAIEAAQQKSGTSQTQTAMKGR